MSCACSKWIGLFFRRAGWGADPKYSKDSIDKLLCIVLTNCGNKCFSMFLEIVVMTKLMPSSLLNYSFPGELALFQTNRERFRPVGRRASPTILIVNHSFLYFPDELAFLMSWPHCDEMVEQLTHNIFWCSSHDKMNPFFTVQLIYSFTLFHVSWCFSWRAGPLPYESGEEPAHNINC